MARFLYGRGRRQVRRYDGMMEAFCGEDCGEDGGGWVGMKVRGFNERGCVRFSAPKGGGLFTTYVHVYVY